MYSDLWLIPCYAEMTYHINILAATLNILRIRSKGLVINYGEGGYKMGECQVRNLLRSPPPLKTG